jgi:hypothetical protein
MATYKSGKDCKVTLGANTVVGMGTWAISGITADQMDASAFNDNWKTFEFGMKDGGTVTFRACTMQPTQRAEKRYSLRTWKTQT